MSQNNYWMLYPNVVTTKGYNRSVIADLYRRRFRYIPNLLTDILVGLKDQPLTGEMLLSKVDPDSRDELSDQLQLLLAEDYLLQSSRTMHERLSVPVAEKTPETLITDCIIELNEDSSYSLPTFFKILNGLGVKFVEIRFLDVSSFEKNFREIQENLADSVIESLQMLAPFDESICAVLKNEYRDFERLNLFTFYNASVSIPFDDVVFGVRFSSQKRIDNSMCGCISPDYFTFDLQNDRLNKTQNNCLAGKLSIDFTGKIKNCPSKLSDYGSLKETNLEDLVNASEFQTDWLITKEKVLICSDCEFRWMCSDCRVFIQDKNNPFSKPAKCKYNPYISKWGWEEGYLPEHETGISIINNKVVIDTEKLNQINTSLWA